MKLLFQGPKLTFFYWRQLATKPKFLVARWKFLVANFFFKNQNEKNAFGAAMAIFQLTNKIKYKDTDYLYSYMYH